MEFFTHIRMSLALKHTIEKATNIKLDSISFIYGNIKPDICKRYIKIPHFKKTSMGFIRERIAEISKISITTRSKCTKEFSVNLGIITHYLSDFFCYAHSDLFTGGAVKHLSYENRLTAFCRTTHILNRLATNHKKYNSICESVDMLSQQLNITSLCRNMSWLEKIYCALEHLHDTYKEQKPSYSLDISSAFNACALLCIFLVEKCTSKSLELAA